MTQKDGSPEASEGPYWSEELLAVLVVGLGDETQARETLEGIIQQALPYRAGRCRPSQQKRPWALGTNVRRENNGSCDGLLYSRCRPGFPPGARDRLGESQTPSIQLPSELSARRFALLAEQRHSLSCRCLLK